MELHALADDFNMNALADVDRSPALTTTFYYYLTDTLGNYLTDTAGNRLIAGETQTVYPQMLSALPDDFSLNSE